MKDDITIDDFFENNSIEDSYYEESVFPISDMINQWIKENCILEGSYKINDDNTIDVDGDILIQIYAQKIKEFPSYIQFNVINGDFTYLINSNNVEYLQSLKGGPKYVKGNFTCNYSRIKTLEHAPIKVEKDFSIQYSFLLESLEGGPKYVGQDYICSDCKSLVSLEGISKYIGHNLYCRRCKMYFPENYVRSLTKVSNKLYLEYRFYIEYRK